MRIEHTAEHTSEHEAPTARRLLSKREILARIPFSYPTIWSMMRKGTFPLSVKLDDAGTKVAWYADEIDQFIESRERVELKPLPSIEAA